MEKIKMKKTVYVEGNNFECYNCGSSYIQKGELKKGKNSVFIRCPNPSCNYGTVATLQSSYSNKTPYEMELIITE